jgi:flagellar motor switch protein FliG
MLNAFDPRAGLTPQGALRLTRKRKAPLNVQLLISDGKKLALSNMPDHMQ